MAVVDVHSGWMREFEAFCLCSECGRSTVFVLHDRHACSADVFSASTFQQVHALSDHVRSVRHISQRDEGRMALTPAEISLLDFTRDLLSGLNSSSELKTQSPLS
ncbi:hypothetical protein [Variovorax soli]